VFGVGGNEKEKEGGRKVVSKYKGKEKVKGKTRMRREKS
jgi:hypothetical protein